MISDYELEVCSMALYPMNTILRINGPDNVIGQYNKLVEAYTVALDSNVSEFTFHSSPMSFQIQTETGEVLNVFPKSPE